MKVMNRSDSFPLSFVCFLGSHWDTLWWDSFSTLNIYVCGWIKLAQWLYTKKLILLRRMICYTEWKTFHSQDCEDWGILARGIHSKTGPWWHLFWMGKWGIKIEIHLWHFKIHLYFCCFCCCYNSPPTLCSNLMILFL